MKTILLKTWGWILIILFLAAPVSAFRVDLVYNKPFADANKTSKKDDLMCWAAVAANMVSWHQASDAQITFEWAINELEDKYHRANTIEQGIGLFGWSSNLELTTGDIDSIEWWILGSLLKGQVVAIVVRDDSLYSPHALTVYGFSSSKKGMYIEYVDSDDNVRKIYTSKLIKKDGFLIFKNGEYNKYVITFVHSLRNN
jgi:hypothetical protein